MKHSTTDQAGLLLWQWLLGIVLVMLLGGAAILYGLHRQTGQALDMHQQQVISAAQQAPLPVWNEAEISALPAPVERYLRFTFPEPPKPVRYVRLSMSGNFRRPLHTEFQPTTAEQTIATNTPALLFAAKTPLVSVIWATAYDAYVNGHMTMKAKILGAVTVMDQPQTPELNRISLRRWLLESPLYPHALLPGGPVQWQAVDNLRARAVVSAFGQRVAMLATFREDGSLQQLDAEEDGDLQTPYHGSGEHVLRTDYREHNGVMIPFGFTIARSASGQIYPFWQGEVTSMRFYP